MQPDEELRILDEMMADLGGSNTAPACDLLLEHLRAARRNLLGAMPREYRLCLELARESVASIPHKAAGTETKKMLRYLIDSEMPKQRPSTGAGPGPLLPNPAPLASAS